MREESPEKSDRGITRWHSVRIRQSNSSARRRTGKAPWTELWGCQARPPEQGLVHSSPLPSSSSAAPAGCGQGENARADRLRDAPTEFMAPASPLPRESRCSGCGAAAGTTTCRRSRAETQVSKVGGAQDRQSWSDAPRSLWSFRPVGTNAVLSDPFPLLCHLPAARQAGPSVRGNFWKANSAHALAETRTPTSAALTGLPQGAQ